MNVGMHTVLCWEPACLKLVECTLRPVDARSLQLQHGLSNFTGWGRDCVLQLIDVQLLQQASRLLLSHLSGD